MNVTYRPADTDSSDEDDYEGFSYGGSRIDSPKRPRSRSFWVADPDQDLYDAVCSGNLEELIKQIESINFDLNEPIKGGLTLLHHACKFGHYEIVKYLLERKAKANRQVDSTTPLMEACSCIKDGQSPKNIVKLLLDYGAVVNVSDKYGMTPFMFACINGYADVVAMLICKVSLEACDNQGYTALFHAIENNHAEVVKILVAEGVNVDIANCRGYTPRQVAQFHGFHDILELFPLEEYKALVPMNYLSYNNIQDYIPRLFLKSDTPEYFQEISLILSTLHLERFLINFAKNKIDLTRFLTITEDELKAIGMEYPFHRGKLKLGLLNYHLDHWCKSSIARVTRQDSETFYDILMLSANHVQNLVTIHSSLRYIQQNLEQDICGQIRKEDVKNMKKLLVDYKTVVVRLKKTVKYLSEFSPVKPPLLIDFTEYKASQRRTKYVRNCVKYSLFIGVSIVICLRIKKII